MNTNPENGTKRKPPEALTDAEVFHAIARLTGGYRGHWATYDIETDGPPCFLTLYHSHGWTDADGRAHAQPPDFLHSVDALLPIIRRLSFDAQLALTRRVTIHTPPRVICLEILRAIGHFDP